MFALCFLPGPPGTVGEKGQKGSDGKTAQMGGVVDACAGNAVIDRKESKEDQLPAAQILQSPVVADQNDYQSANDAEDGAGSTGRQGESTGIHEPCD